MLDFYVHESRQRQGVGKRLFEFMLEHQGVRPHRLAYDRPSPKLLGFLGKHYNLKNYTPQANNFVVFKRYFSEGGRARSFFFSSCRPWPSSCLCSAAASPLYAPPPST